MALFPMVTGGGTTGYDTWTTVSLPTYNEGTTQTTSVPKGAIMIFISEYPDGGGGFISNASGMTKLGDISCHRGHSYGRCDVWKATDDSQTFHINLMCKLAYVL